MAGGHGRAAAGEKDDADQQDNTNRYPRPKTATNLLGTSGFIFIIVKHSYFYTPLYNIFGLSLSGI